MAQRNNVKAQSHALSIAVERQRVEHNSRF